MKKAMNMFPMTTYTKWPERQPHSNSLGIRQYSLTEKGAYIHFPLTRTTPKEVDTRGNT